MVMEIPKDPFVLSEMDRKLAPSATREIMFAFLAVDKQATLTPQDLMEQTRNIRLLMGRIDFFLTQWDPKKGVSYWEILSQIDRLIQRNNIATRELRARADQAARDRRDEILDAKVRSIRFGTEKKRG